MVVFMEPGQLIGPYRLESLIAEGGMGAVWRAHHPTLDRLVALKFVKSSVRDHSHAREAFMREVRNLSRLHGPQIVHVLDFGFTDDGDPYMVTEFLQGQDLLTRLRAEERISVRDAVFLGIEVLKALAEAHALGLVHRDLKPGNIFLQRLAGGARMAVKVLDFGVSKLLVDGGADETTLWPNGSPKGSPRYMAPEQIAGEPVTPASDMYAFGATLYRAVSGEPVFAGSIQVMLRSHLESAPVSLRDRFPALEIPAEFDDIVLGCLAKDPNARPRSADALQIRLERLLQRLSDTEGAPVEAGDYAVASPPEPLLVPEAVETLSTGEALPGWLEPSLAPTGSGSLSGADVFDMGPADGAENDGVKGRVEASNDDGSASLGGWGASAALEPVDMELAVPSEDSVFRTDGGDVSPGGLTPEPRSPSPMAPRPQRSSRPARTPSGANVDETQPLRVRPVHLLSATALLLLGVWLYSEHINRTASTLAVTDGLPSVRTYDFGRARWALDLGVEPDAVAPNTPSTIAVEVDAAAPMVRVRVVPGPGTFSEVATGRVICPLTKVCDLPINRDIRVEQAGHRAKILSGDDLHDRRNNTWRIILQPR